MKRGIAILLALCFLMSMTVTAASAAEKSKWDNSTNNDNGHKEKPVNHHKTKFIKVCEWKKPHMEKKVIKKIIHKHHKKVVILKTVYVKVPGKMVCKWVPVKKHQGYR